MGYAGGMMHALQMLIVFAFCAANIYYGVTDNMLIPAATGGFVALAFTVAVARVRDWLGYSPDVLDD